MSHNMRAHVKVGVVQGGAVHRSIYDQLTQRMSVSIGLLCCVGIGLLGCGSDTTGLTSLTASQAYWALRLNYHAVNLALQAPYNTVQLRAVPVNAYGDTLRVAAAATFTSADSTVSVDSTGFVTANYRTRNVQTPTRIIASLQYQNVTLKDTVLIQVTPVVPSVLLATFVLQPAAGASTTCNLDLTGGSPFIKNCGPVVVVATDMNGDTVVNANRSTLLIHYATSNSHIATIDQTGVMIEADTGHMMVTASTWAYGVPKRDSLRWVVSWPQYNNVQITKITPVNSLTPVLEFEPSKIVGVGGTVVWYNPYADPIDIIFDDSTTVKEGCLYLRCGILPSTGEGNVPPFYTDATYTDHSAFALGFVGRLFPVAGTYYYHSRLYPSSTGVILVKENLTP